MTERLHFNANPRKFKEKIELLRQKEAQLTANFVEVMQGIPTLTRHVAPFSDSLDKHLQQSIKCSSPSEDTSINFQRALESTTAASPTFYAESTHQCAPKFYRPTPPPSRQLEPVREQPFRGFTCQSTWRLPGGATGSSLAPTAMIGGMMMSLMDHRRTYSDSCIPSNFSDALDPTRRYPPCHQYHHHLQQQLRTLPPVDELTGSCYESTNTNAASKTYHTPSGFHGSPIPSPRYHHQTSTSVYHQPPPRRIQATYHSMRNIPQRCVPVDRYDLRHLQQTPVTPPVQSQVKPLTGNGGNYVWMMNGGSEEASTFACHLSSPSPGLNLKRSSGYEHCLSNVPPESQVPVYHTFTPTTTVAITNHADNLSSPLTQPFDIGAIDIDNSPNQRRDSFNMAVDLFSRLEKRPLDTYLAAPSTNSPSSSPSPPLLITASAVTSQWARSSVTSSSPLKKPRIDPFTATHHYSTSTTDTSSTPPIFYVPIAANDLQLLTEPSMVNYVTDAATEDQLIREQYSTT